MSDSGFNTTDGIFLGAGLGAAAALSRQQRTQNELLWHSMTPAQQASYNAHVARTAGPSAFEAFLALAVILGVLFVVGVVAFGSSNSDCFEGAAAVANGGFDPKCVTP